jgi:hypothetical protein
VAHYLRGGPLRPDITLTVDRGGLPTQAILFECKHSANPSYLAQGFREATLYRWEYAAFLIDSLKAVLITSEDIVGHVRDADEVVAVDWRRWVVPRVIDAICRMTAQARRSG